VLADDRLQVADVGGRTHERQCDKVDAEGEREFEVVDAEWRGERLTFPRDGFVCVGVLAARTE